MKTLKIILCIIAVGAVFFCGVAYQSYSNHTDEYVESKDTVETTVKRFSDVLQTIFCSAVNGGRG